MTTFSNKFKYYDIIRSKNIVYTFILFTKEFGYPKQKFSDLLERKDFYYSKWSFTKTICPVVYSCHHNQCG